MRASWYISRMAHQLLSSPTTTSASPFCHVPLLACHRWYLFAHTLICCWFYLCLKWIMLSNAVVDMWYGLSEYFIWKGHNLVIIVRAIIIVWSSREHVHSVASTRYVLQLIVEVLQEADISGYLPIYFLRVLIILQICMICVHLHGILHSCQ